MDPTPFRAYMVIRWSVFLVLTGSLCVFLALFSFFLFVLMIPFVLLSAAMLYWIQKRMQNQLERHGGSIPMPGLIGYLGADVTDTPPNEGNATRSPGTPHLCPSCGELYEQGDATCRSCGASLWT